ncbi:MAG: S-layer homology domain-containing protein [Oscillospiraceae bacterium]|nr:S-layer homology domain-containing protein [Oscillospiraceae bacterium]
MKQTRKRTLRRLAACLLMAALLAGNVTVLAEEPASDAEDVAAAKSMIESVVGNLTVAQGLVNSEDIAETYVHAYTGPVELLYGVTAVVNTTSFTAAEEGTAAVPNGTNGSYVFTVTVSKGTVSDTVNGTLTITAISLSSEARIAAAVTEINKPYAPLPSVTTEAEAKTAAQNVINSRIAHLDVAAELKDIAFTPPSVAEGTLKFTVTVSRSGTSQTTGQLEMTIPALSQNQLDVNNAAIMLTWYVIRNNNAPQDAVANTTASRYTVASNLSLLTSIAGASGVTISWALASGSGITISGTVGTITATTQQNVTLRATLSKGGASAAKDFYLTVTPGTDAAQVAAVKNWLEVSGWNAIRGSNASSLSGSPSAYSVTHNLPISNTSGANRPVIPASHVNYNGVAVSGVSITWSVVGGSSSATVNVNTGAVTFPLSGSGQTVTLRATVRKGSTTATQDFPLRIMPLTDQALVNLVAQELVWNVISGVNTAQTNVTDRLTLPLVPVVRSGSSGWYTQPAGTTINGISITWTQLSPSSPVYVVTSGTDIGRVVRPASDQTVTLRATVEKGSGSAYVMQTKDFVLTVKLLTNADAVRLAAQEIAWNDIRHRNSSQTAVFSDLALPESEDRYGTAITWTSNNRGVVSDAGVVTPPASGSATARLTAVFSKGTGSAHVTRERTFDVTVVAPSASQEVVAAAAALRWDTVKNQNTNRDAVTTRLVLPDTGRYDTAITWSSNRTGTITNTGDVLSPTSGSAVPVTLTATVRKGNLSETVTIAVTVKVLTNAEAVAAEKTDLTWDVIKGANAQQNQVRRNLALSSSGSKGTSIAWSSNRTEVVSHAGQVTRPAANTSVTLTATIERGTSRDTKTFTLIVLAENAGNFDVAESQTKMTARTSRNEFAAQTLQGTRGFEIQSDLCDLAFDEKAAGTINSLSNGDVVITAEKLDWNTLPLPIRNEVGDRGLYDLTLTGGTRTISEFGGGTATVRIPYTLRTGENPNAIIVYFIDAASRLRLTRGYWDAAAREVVFRTKHFSRFAVAYRPVVYNDVPAGVWYRNAVEFIAARSFPVGITGTQFEPGKALTRGEFTAALMNAYGVELDVVAGDNFADVNPAAPYARHLATGKRLGIITGVGDNNYAPERTITRQEMFALLYNILMRLDEVPPPAANGGTLSGFPDGGDVHDTLVTAISTLVRAGVIAGGDGGRLHLTVNADRAQMAGMIYNLLGP